MVRQTQTAVTQDTMSGWWPPKYGAGDQAGALNEITPAKVLEAVRLVRQGRVYDLAHVLHQDIPAFPGRTFRQYLTTNYHHINRRRPDAGPAGLGRNSVNWIVEQVTATQQMGTHMDGLNHLQVGDRTYNGFRLAELAADYTRHSRSPRAAFAGLLTGYSLTRVLCYVIGLLTLVTVAHNPQDIYGAFIALPLGALGFAILAARELDQSFANVYSTAVST